MYNDNEQSNFTPLELDIIQGNSDYVDVVEQGVSEQDYIVFDDEDYVNVIKPPCDFTLPEPVDIVGCDVNKADEPVSDYSAIIRDIKANRRVSPRDTVVMKRDKCNKGVKDELSKCKKSGKGTKKHKCVKKKKRTNPVLKTFKVISIVFLSLFMICVITVSILAAALTVYIMQFRDSMPIDITLDDTGLAYTTFIYGTDKNGGLVELKRISREANRIPVDIEDIPQHVRDAFVYIEDERFYEHAGVDWKRTFGAVLNELTGGMLYGSRQGGSTITQQLVKNVTTDTAQTWDRKLREIFRASDLEQYVPKSEILEGYLNCIGFGGNTNGIQAASLKYFGKDVSELDLAEAACLAAIPKSPETLNPFTNPAGNEKRRQLVLDMMYKNAAISENEYIKASIEELQFRDYEAEKAQGTYDEVQSWYVDMVIRDVTHDLQDMYGVDFETASDMLYNGGYTVYTPIDVEMQRTIEQRYADYKTFSNTVLNDPPESAFIVMDYMGNIKAVAGGVGEKAGSNVWNRATMSPRQPGSSIKPLAGYGFSIEHNLITWSTIMPDLPIEIPDEEHPGEVRKWPTNYSSTSRNDVWSGKSYFVYDALQRSLNTVSARLVQSAQPALIFNVLQNRFRFTTLNAYDADLSPLSVGAFTEGVYLRELVGAYEVFGNGGKYYEPTSYTYVEAHDGEVILQHKYTGIQSIGEDTAWVMNRMLKQVVEGAHGTGKLAKLDTVEVVGKTGTSQGWHDNLFICCTPEYVSGIWYGYDDMRTVPSGTYYGTAQLWKNVFGDIADAEETKEFKPSENVDELAFCSNTGMIAGPSCPTFAKGYYKRSNTPQVCTVCGSNSGLLQALEGNEQQQDNRNDSLALDFLPTPDLLLPPSLNAQGVQVTVTGE